MKNKKKSNEREELSFKKYQYKITKRRILNLFINKYNIVKYR